MTTTMKARMTETMKSAECGKCDGTGTLAAYGHIADGVCFACSGSGRRPMRPLSAAAATMTPADAAVGFLSDLVRAGRSRTAGQARRQWAAAVDSCQDFPVRQYLSAAPPHLAARASAALRALGVSV